MQMARIGRQIPHFEAVDLNSVEAVFSADKCYRYLLSMKRKTKQPLHGLMWGYAYGIDPAADHMEGI